MTYHTNVYQSNTPLRSGIFLKSEAMPCSARRRVSLHVRCIAIEAVPAQHGYYAYRVQGMGTQTRVKNPIVEANIRNADTARYVT